MPSFAICNATGKFWHVMFTICITNILPPKTLPAQNLALFLCFLWLHVSVRSPPFQALECLAFQIRQVTPGGPHFPSLFVNDYFCPSMLSCTVYLKLLLLSDSLAFFSHHSIARRFLLTHLSLLFTSPGLHLEGTAS